MIPVLLNLGGIAVGGALWLLLIASYPAIPISSPLTPVMTFVMGLTFAKIIFDWIAKIWPGSFLAQAVSLSFAWRQIIGLGGLILTLGWLFAAS